MSNTCSSSIIGKGPCVFVTNLLICLWSEDFIPSMTQEEYDAQPTKDNIFTFKDLDIEATPTQKIAFNLNYLHRFREEGGHFYPIKFVNGVSLDFGSIIRL